MIITAVSPLEPNGRYQNNNRFTCVYNDPIYIPRRSKVTIHSAYLSYLPYIVIESNVNDRVVFEIAINANPATLVTLTIPSGSYTAQQLANQVTTQWFNQGTASPYDEVSFQCLFNNITGCFSFVFTLENPSAPTPDQYDILYYPSNSSRATQLSYLMGFHGRDRELGFTANVAGESIIMEADASTNYSQNSPIALINVENFAIKNANNLTSVSLRYAEHIRKTYAQCLNNSFITPYAKLYTSLNNDDQVILNNIDITIRNADGSLMDLDPDKPVAVLLEVKQEDEDEVERKRELVVTGAKNPFLK